MPLRPRVTDTNGFLVVVCHSRAEKTGLKNLSRKRLCERGKNPVLPVTVPPLVWLSTQSNGGSQSAL